MIFKNDWADLLDDELNKDYYQSLREWLKKEYDEHTVYPPMFDIFNAFHYTSYEDVKVVLLGQDPYHGPNQAEGMSFSVKKGVKIPPSLRNMYKELESDIGCPVPEHGSLVKWAKEGVLLLNTVLTVRDGEAHSHRNQGWERLTDHVIKTLNDRQKPVVFILWGKPAQAKEKLIDQSVHFILKSPHPSPLSAHRGFLGSEPYSRTNQFLKEHHIPEIDWCID
ncbi:uracil-DNA glycosylase [Rossellomorea marisflavi]|jgi:uracil-DNA glycosylase|uniref:uracil-DNA glycosylase n=1 Tax=Rossellomorea marisflavi TaxID=189381 RepID=UPI002852F8E5|nr:uracil-DNA glycosylase [Rossellomorea marisflavi]MDR4935118.1 uracil-DNA glycosylase [Rossellomorea marisflavi]